MVGKSPLWAIQPDNCEKAEALLRDLAENPLRNQSETSIRNQSEQALQARARDIIKLQANGTAKPEIVRLLWGVSPGNNDAYRQANDEWTNAMKIIHSMIREESEEQAS